MGAGVWVWGPNTVPLACMPCGCCVQCGWWGSSPGGGGGWPATVVRGVWCQALSLPRPPVLWGRQPGFRDPCVPSAVGVGDLLREVTEEVFTEANEDVILESFNTVKLSSPTPTPREFIHWVEQFLALGRHIRDGITQRQAKERLLDVIATMKVDELLKEIFKEETKVGLEFNYL